MKVNLYSAKEESRQPTAQQILDVIYRTLGPRPSIPLVDGDLLIVASDIGRVYHSGIEEKTAKEMAGCVLHTNRHLDQLRRMKQVYDEVTLLIVGRVVPSDDGVASEPMWGRGLQPLTPHYAPTTMTYQRWDKHLQTLKASMGINVIEADSSRHAAQRILNLFDWWRTPPDDHMSHLGKFSQVSLVPGEEGRASLVRRVVAELPGVGLVRSRAVEDVVRQSRESLRDLINWDEKRWMDVPGIGKVTAEEAVKGTTEKLS